MIEGASLAMSMFSGWLGRQAQAAQNIVFDAQAKAENTVREGKNVEAAAQAGLANWMVSENNRRRLNAAGQQRAAMVQTQMRQRENIVAGSIEQQVQDAEAAGAYAANVAMSGAAGASVDIIDMAMQLKQQRQMAYQQKQAGYADYDMQQQVAGIIPQAIEGLDLSMTAAPLDYSKTFSQARKPQGNFLLDAAQWAIANPAAANSLGGKVGSFFDKPAATTYSPIGLKMPREGLTFGSTKVPRI